MMPKKPKYQIAYHPGENILEELQARGWSQKFFADLIMKSPVEINYIIKGTKSINVDFAIRIGIAFGTSAEVWLGLQNMYDIYKMWQKHEKEYDAITKPLPPKQ